MIPQLNKITHTKKVAALSIVIVVSFSRMERRARIELATRTWKDRVIPFYERRLCFNYITNHWVCLCCLAGGIGIEPMRGGIKIRCLTSWRTPNWIGSQWWSRTTDPRLIKTLLYPWANWPKTFGGNDWIWTSNNLRMKEADYRCPTLPYRNTLACRTTTSSTGLPLLVGNVFLYGRATRIRTEVLHLKRVML
jgi:hypothetical protein